MDFAKFEASAKEKAAIHVAHMLHTPDKLEKVHQLRANESRKKASVEAMLKTAMQSQLDEVKAGLEELNRAMGELREVRIGLNEIEKDFQVLPPLLSNLEDLRNETTRHSQLATAQENLKHLILVPRTVKEMENFISEGKLLEAHKLLVDLETRRDDLLIELHKLKNLDMGYVINYFQPVQQVSEMMEKHLKLNFRRILNTVRKDPKVIVTALRIIEREEQADEELMSRKNHTEFIPPGRPKNWKSVCLSVLKQNVMERIEGNQLVVREEDKMWLVKHLELIRMIFVEDMRVARYHCQPVFPPSYDIFNYFMKLYKEALENRLQEIIQSGLKGQEYVSLLSWVIQIYPGPEMMRHPGLMSKNDEVKPILGEAMIGNLQQEYLENLQESFDGWMKNAMTLEVEDWKKKTDPETDSEGCYHTSAPKILYQMLDENIQVASTISPDLTSQVLILSMEALMRFGLKYRKAIGDYKELYFRDRNSISRFTRYMIAIVNNCEKFVELSEDLQSRWWIPCKREEKWTKTIDALIKALKELRGETIGHLLDELSLDIDLHFAEILTTKWQGASTAVATISMTLEDYFHDYYYLSQENYLLVLKEAQDRVARKYITAMLQPSANPLRKKITFDNPNDRSIAADQIISESSKLQGCFDRMSKGNKLDDPFKALTIMSEVIRGEPDMLSLDIGKLVQDFPDVTSDQIYCLLMLRGDFTKANARERSEEAVRNRKPSPGTEPSIFSQVNVNPAVTLLTTGKEAAATLNPFAKETASNLKEAAANLNPFSTKKDTNNPFDDDEDFVE